MKETRSFVRRTLLALVMTAGMVVVVLAAASAISAMALIERLLPFSSPFVHGALKLLFWAFAALAVSGGIALLYRYAPNRPDAPWRWITPGSAAATLLWLPASFGFGLYVSNFGNYNATYGSLGGVVVFLTWLYLSSYILLMGGELNSELERQQASAGANAAQIGHNVRPLAGAGDACEGHAGARRDRLGIGDEAVEQGCVPAGAALRQGAERGRIFEPALGGDPPAEDPVKARPRQSLPRFKRVAGIAFLIGALAAPRLLRLARAGGQGAARG